MNMKLSKIAMIIGILSIYGISNAGFAIKIQLEPNMITLKEPSNNSGETPEVPVDPEPPVEPAPLAEMKSASGPETVFFNYPFELALDATNATKYKIKSNNGNAGVSASGIIIDNISTYSVTPTQPGNYEYSISAINEDGKESSSMNVAVHVENYPTIDNITVNGTSNFLHTTKGNTLNLSASVSEGSQLVQNVPATASNDPGEYTYKLYAEKTLNGVTKKSADSNFVVATGTLITVGVGQYKYGSTQVLGYVDTSKSVYVAETVGNISINNISGNPIYHLYQNLNGGSIVFGFAPSSPDGFFTGGKIWINNQLCGQTTTSYGSTVDSYLFAGCPVRLGSASVGTNVKIYY